MLCRFFIGPVIQFYWYWLPSYLFSAKHLSLAKIGAMSWIPFFRPMHFSNAENGWLPPDWAASILLLGTNCGTRSDGEIDRL